MPPTIRKIEVTNKTLSEISVKVTSARAEGATYKYSIKKLEEADTAYEEKEDEGGETYTFTGLTSPETYTIKVDLVIKGEIKDSKTENVMLGELEEGAITFEGPIWPGNGTASAIVKTNTSYQLQYQINAIEDNGWQNISNGGTVTNIPAKESNLYARLWDGTNASDYATLPISDTVEPKITEIKEVEVTETTIKVQVVATDNESGITKIEYSSNDGANYVTGTTATSTEYTFENLEESTEYTIKVKVTDGVGNTAELSKKITTDGEKFSDIYETTTEYTDSEGNTAWIPGGFAVGIDEDINKISDGLVIKDSKGNKFVWIPVGEYKTSSGNRTNNLARRTFTSSGAIEVEGDGVIDSIFYGEGDSRTGLSEAIKEFKTSVSKYGGYYIGRYEQGIGNVIKKNIKPWVNITAYETKLQANAVEKENQFVKSEIISSYGWDTALNFICQTSTNGYTLATTADRKYGNFYTDTVTEYGLTNTGMYTADNYSNIHDMLGNVSETSSEFCPDLNGIVQRGGWYGAYYNAAKRSGYDGQGFNSYGFRTQMYIK